MRIAYPRSVTMYLNVQKILTLLLLIEPLQPSFKPSPRACKCPLVPGICYPALVFTPDAEDDLANRADKLGSRIVCQMCEIRFVVLF